MTSNETNYAFIYPPDLDSTQYLYFKNVWIIVNRWESLRVWKKIKLISNVNVVKEESDVKKILENAVIRKCNCPSWVQVFLYILPLSKIQSFFFWFLALFSVFLLFILILFQDIVNPMINVLTMFLTLLPSSTRYKLIIIFPFKTICYSLLLLSLSLFSNAFDTIFVRLRMIVMILLILQVIMPWFYGDFLLIQQQQTLKKW